LIFVAMAEQISNSYYSEMRSSVDELFELDLQVVPAISCSVDRDEYTGLDEFNEWRDGGCDNTEDPGGFGLEGDEISGTWSSDHSSFHGFFPASVRPNGDYVLTTKHRKRSYEEVHQQIDLAQEYGVPLGIAVNTLNARHCFDKDCEAPNSVIYAGANMLRFLCGGKNIRIESDGRLCWAYAFVNLRSDDIFDWFDGASKRRFGLNDNNRPVGIINTSAIVPAYPSYVLGTQIQLLTPEKNKAKWIMLSAQAAGIHFDVEAFSMNALAKSDDSGIQCSDVDGASSYLDESLEWCHTPEEEDDIFNRTVAQFEALSKPSKEIKRHKPPGESLTMLQETVEEAGLSLFDVLPQQLATSLSIVKENLPYDSLCVLVSFLTGVASMLRLGTSVTGNELTDYKVPINLYTILRAASGRKKSALQKLFVDQPASDVLLKVAQQNDRIMHAWREENRETKGREKTAQPVSVEIRINDYTGEAFVQALGKLDEVGRAVLVVREEIAGLFDSLNAYKSGKGADEQQLLELYDGHGFRSLRVGDKGRAFSRAAVNIYGTIQPDVLDGLLRNGDASGLWARFCFAAMPDMTKKLPTKSDPEMLKAFTDAQQYLKDVVSTVYELRAVNYRLDAQAMELFSDYELKKQEDALSAKISAQAALYGKSAGKVLRFAGILHILEVVVNKLVGAELITATTLQKAIDIVDRQDRWTLACHARLAGVTTETLTPFQRRLHTIAFKAKSPMSWTEIRQKMSSAERQGKDVRDAEEAMDKLVALGLGEVSRGPNGGLCYKALNPIPAQ
jgi:hypothetical protein